MTEKETKYVTWAALTGILGSICVFFLLVIVQAFSEMEGDTNIRIDRASDAIQHFDSELRTDIRELQNDIDTLHPPVIEYPEGMDPEEQIDDASDGVSE